MRMVVKIGTRSLLTPEHTLDTAMIGSLVDQIADLKRHGHAVALVSSGAVGAGRDLWQKNSRKRGGSDSVLEKQVLASLGQAALIHHYNQALQNHDMTAAQLLLTRHDFRYRRHSVNVGRLLETLLAQDTVLPLINENDSLAVEELMFTDNDELAGLLAAQIGADTLVMLTDVAGVLDDSGAVIPEIDSRSQRDIDVRGRRDGAGGRGGMASKLKTARKMGRIGITTFIAPARTPDVLVRLLGRLLSGDSENGDRIGTRILPQRKAKPMKRWLATGVQETRGRIVVNDRLAARLTEKQDVISLLPVGITRITTPFDRNDVVEIVTEKGDRIGHGLARYDSEALTAYLGRRNQPVFIHYDALHIKHV